MKITVITSELSKALSIASKFVSPRANLPILGNILLRTEGAKLVLMSTDLEVSFVTSIGAKIDDPGEIAVPARAMTELITNLGTKNITLEVKGETLELTSESFKSDLSGVNTADFPKIKTEMSESTTELLSKSFIPSLNKVLFSVGIDESRPTLTGVLFFMEKESLILVATDGFRLSQKKILNFSGNIPKTIIPKRVLAEIPKLFVQNFNFDLRSEDNQVVFSDGHTTLSSRIIEGSFPNFERIIPKETTSFVSVSKEELHRALKLASVFARDNANTIKVTISTGMVKISGESPKYGKQEMEIPAKVEGEGLEILLNVRYLEEFLNVVAGENVDIRLSDPSTPIILSDSKDPEFIHVIAPVRS